MEKIKILIIEDEVLIALDIKCCLESLGYEVTTIANNYESSLKSFINNEPNLIISDIYLENSINGIEIIKRLKRLNDIPVIFLSAYSDETLVKKIAKLDSEAYLMKPFRIIDLSSTISLTLYKTKIKSEENTYYNLGNSYIFDQKRELIILNKKEIRLSKNEILLLKLLIQAKNEVVTFEIIESIIWRDKSISDSAMRTLLYRLRSKLFNDVIETIHTFGCKLKY